MPNVLERAGISFLYRTERIRHRFRLPGIVVWKSFTGHAKKVKVVFEGTTFRLGRVPAAREHGRIGITVATKAIYADPIAAGTSRERRRARRTEIDQR